jgi:hypothetical protein
MCRVSARPLNLCERLQAPDEVPPGLRPSAGFRLWTPGIGADGRGSGGAGVSMGGDVRAWGPALTSVFPHRWPGGIHGRLLKVQVCTGVPPTMYGTWPPVIPLKKEIAAKGGY